jgi:uncharacterized protein YjiS (DUF1127 family)
MSFLFCSQGPVVGQVSVHRPGPWVTDLYDRVLNWWRAQRRRSEDRQVLLHMSTRDLNDLGLGRGDVDYHTMSSTPDRWGV